MKFCKEIYFTKDLYEASFLYAQGQKILRLEPEGRYFFFVFEKKSVCKTLSDAYWQEEATVNAKRYADAIRTLKDRIFAQLSRKSK